MNFIIDGMNIAYRSHYVHDVQQGLKTSSGVPTGIVYGFLKTLLKWKDEFPHHHFVVAWDDPDATQKRQEIYEDYKADRDRNFATIEHPDKEGEVIDEFSLQIEFLSNFLRSLGVDQVSASAMEADDVIGSLVRGELSDAQNNIILSSDRDLLQLVSWNTLLMTPGGDKYDPDTVQEEYGVSPEDLVCYRSLDGDDSDNLPGLPYFRRKVIARLVNDYDGELESIYNAELEEELTDKEYDKISSFEDQAYVNREVMKLRDVEKYEVIEGEWNEEEIEGMCDILEFESLRSDLVASNDNQGFLRFNHESTLYSTG